MSAMLKSAIEKNKSSWFLVHRKELIDQTAGTFEKYNIPFGIIAAGVPENPDALIQICSVQTLMRRLEKYSKPDLVVWDESHHCGAKSWTDIYKHTEDKYHIGLTATPVRLDGKGLGRWFDVMVQGPKIPWLIENKYLSDFKVYAPDIPDLSGVTIQAGDYSTAELTQIMMGKALVGNVVHHWLKLARGKLTIGFAPSIAASKAYVYAFKAAGVRAEHLDANTPKDERRKLCLAFARRELDILFNVDLFGEGFDLSALAGIDVAIEAAILCRPTQSLGLYKQQVGRALRIKPDHAIILDHAGNALRHGMPDDEPEWTLKDQPKKKSTEMSIAVRRCPVCFITHRTSDVCPECGHIYEITAREYKIVHGDLKELKRIAKDELKKQKEISNQKKKLEKEAFKKRHEERKRRINNTRTLEGLLELEKEFGYERGWARIKYRSRGSR